MTSVDAIGSPRRRVRTAAVALLALLLAGVFAGLGSWQLQRLAWKQDLMARVAHARSAQARPAPGPSQWAGLHRQRDEYRRVEVRGRYAHELATRVRTLTVLGSGYWLLTPLRTEQGWWLLVNRGFVPPEQPGKAEVALDEPADEQRVVGLLRMSEPGGNLLRSNQPTEARWYSRDVEAIAAASRLGSAAGPAAAPVAPYFIDEVAPSASAAAPSSRFPRPGLTVLSFSNNHLGYALTWFALAIGVIAAAFVVLRAERQPDRIR